MPDGLTRMDISKQKVDKLQSSGELDKFFDTPDPWGYGSHPDDSQRVRNLLSALQKQSYKRVLDIGCGSGYVTTRLPGDVVTGIDFSSAAIEWARERAHREGRTNCEFQVCSIFDLDSFTPASFDLVVITGVLYQQYIGQAFSLISDKIMRLMTPGGYLVHVHIEAWFPHAFPLDRIQRRTYPYRDFIHLLEVYRNDTVLS